MLQRFRSITAKILFGCILLALDYQNVFAADSVPGLTPIKESIQRCSSELKDLEVEYQKIPEIVGDSHAEQYYIYGKGALENARNATNMSPERRKATLENAAIMLLGAVDPPLTADRDQIKDKDWYADAIRSLGDTYRLLGNLGGAKKEYLKLLSPEVNNPRTRNIALVHLITLSNAQKDYKQAKDYISLYQKATNSQGITKSDEVNYYIGKMYFMSDEPENAERFLKSVQKGHEFYLRAQYVYATTLLKSGKLIDALKHFDWILRNVAPITEADRDIRELTHLARARLYYELEKYSSAVDAYNYIRVDSDYLATMLYEVTWTYVRKAGEIRRNDELSKQQKLGKVDQEYTAALERLQVLEYLERDSKLEPEIKILKGNLHIQRKDYEQARLSFSEVAQKYNAADFELQKMESDPEKRKQLLNEIISLEGGALNAETNLPRLAAMHAKDSPDVQKALRIYLEIKEIEEYISESNQQLESLEKKLSMGDHAGIFKEVAAPLTRAKANEANILKAQASLLNKKRNLAIKKANASQKEQLLFLAEQTSQMQVKLNEITTSAAGIKKEKKGRLKHLRGLGQNLVELRVAIMGIKAQVRAIDQILAQEHHSSTASPLELKNLGKQLAFFYKYVKELEQKEIRLKSNIRDMRDEIRMTSGRGFGDNRTISLFEKAVAEEETLLNEILGVNVGAFSTLQAVLTQVKSRNHIFLEKIERIVARRVAKYRIVLDDERKKLTAYASKVSALLMNAESFKEETVAVSLKNIRRVLDKIVIGADVGLVDTAWAKKQEQTNKIGVLQREKSAILTDLNQAYADITQDEVNE